MRTIMSSKNCPARSSARLGSALRSMRACVRASISSTPGSDGKVRSQ